MLEAREPGFGGSGRNGGQVIPGLKFDPDELETMFGKERGPRLVDFVSRTADVVWELIDKHKMDVPNTRTGWIQSAISSPAVGPIEARAEQWQKRGAPVDVLDRRETERYVGHGQYLASWIDRRGGVVQPLAYARGLAKAALAAGATIHGNTLATGLARENGKWIVSTRQGATVTADRVVLATNGYTGDLGRICGRPSSPPIPSRSRPSRCRTMSASRSCRAARRPPIRAASGSTTGSTIPAASCWAVAGRCASPRASPTGRISRR